MIDESKYVFRDATIKDIDFLAFAIVEAKKGGSNMVGMANLFGLSEESFKEYVHQMLEEDIDGCDFSVSSFIIVEYNGEPVATFGGWIECDNEDEMPSALLKANLIGYVIPLKNVLRAQEKSQLVDDLQVERFPGTYQLEYGYTIPEHRGHHLIRKLIEKHIERAKKSPKPVIAAYTKSGFRVIQTLTTENPDILTYYPHNRELFMEKVL